MLFRSPHIRDAIDEAELDRLQPRVDPAIGQTLHGFAIQVGSPANDDFDEAVIHLIDDGLKQLPLLGAHGSKRRARILMGTGRDCLSFDADLVHRFAHVE